MDQVAFKKLFDRYFDTVRNYLLYRCGDPDLATDIAQDAFMRVWEKQLDFIPGKEIGLLYKIASDMFVSKYRRSVVETNYRGTLSMEFHHISPEDELSYSQLQHQYADALGEMPEKARIVYLMSRAEELKYQEIAERLNLSVKAVEKRMQNALAFLRKKLDYKAR